MSCHYKKINRLEKPLFFPSTITISHLYTHICVSHKEICAYVHKHIQPIHKQECLLKSEIDYSATST